jgi:hypothetical protein
VGADGKSTGASLDDHEPGVRCLVAGRRCLLECGRWGVDTAPKSPEEDIMNMAGDRGSTSPKDTKPRKSHTVGTVLGIIWTIAVIVAPADIIGACHGEGWNAAMTCTGPGAMGDLAIRAGLIAAWWVVAWFVRN